MINKERFNPWRAMGRSTSALLQRRSPRSRSNPGGTSRGRSDGRRCSRGSSNGGRSRTRSSRTGKGAGYPKSSGGASLRFHPHHQIEVLLQVEYSLVSWPIHDCSLSLLVSLFPPTPTPNMIATNPPYLRTRIVRSQQPSVLHDGRRGLLSGRTRELSWPVHSTNVEDEKCIDERGQ